jgi:hypothetical protein
MITSLQRSGVPPGHEVMLGETPEQNERLAEIARRNPSQLTSEQRALLSLAQRPVAPGTSPRRRSSGRMVWINSDPSDWKT